MPNVELDSEVLAYLEKQVRGFGETPNSVLRRLLRIGDSDRSENQIVSKAIAPPKEKPIQPEPPSSPQILEPGLLTRVELVRHRNAKLRYLAILGKLHALHREAFVVVEKITGRKRLYFSTSEQAIERSGLSVMPERIPGSPYFCATNLSDLKKQVILREVLEKLGYERGRQEGILIQILGDGIPAKDEDAGKITPFQQLDSTDLENIQI